MVLGLSILVYRYTTRPNGNGLFTRDAQGALVLNEQLFQRGVVEDHRQVLDRYYINLMVFVDPAFPCPGYLQSVLTLHAKDKAGPDLFNVVFFVPEDVEASVLQDFHDRTPGLTTLTVETESMAASLAGIGLYKVLYSQDGGIIYFDKGDLAPDDMSPVFHALMDYYGARGMLNMASQ